MDFNLLTSLNDNIRIDRSKCTACARCVEVCVLDNLRLQLSPCRQACPVGMNCQGYIHHLVQGKMDKGLEKVREAVPFGGILGRVCSRPCEAACNRIKVDQQPVAIRDLKRFLADQDGKCWRPPAVPDRSQKIAVVGAGPAGLTAAFYLRSWGFRVTLYDRESAPGGLMRWAIPEFRLPLEVLERELGFIKAMGIDFQANRTLEKDLDLEKLEEKNDAVLLALGAYGQPRLGVSGEDAQGVMQALDFMKRVREKNPPRVGPRVIVVGGGNAAVDAAQTALRLGARKVHLVSLEKKDEMPAFRWSVAEAEEEGVDIQNGWGPMRFRMNGGKVAGVSFKKCMAVCDSQGIFRPSYDEKTALDLPADTVILAIGQKAEREMLPPSLYSPEGVRSHSVTFQTPRPKIFCAGDFLKGPQTLVEAMAQGKEAALSIQRLLQGEDLEYGRVNPTLYELQFEPDFSRAKPRQRIAMPAVPLPQRKGFEEVAKGYSKEEALAEAERCLDCGVPFGIRTCWFCLPCEIECPEEALYVEIPYLLR
ncbi:MAG: FAD-dependent oxidoreductase [Syntrophaceae bacterium]|nr:FAD-dependent oxidoreductase [Syntrophaceae bacterium]